MRALKHIVLVLACLLLPRWAQAENASTEVQQRALADSTIVLQGLRPKATTFHDFGPVYLRTGQVILTLQAELSDALEAEDSTLTVSVDGVPMKTLRLGSTLRALEIPLGHPGAGYHSVTLSANLSVKNDECDRDLQETVWLKVTTSELKWLAFVQPPELPAVREAASAFADGATVEVQPPERFSQEAALAALETVSWLVQRKARFVRDEADRVFQLRVDDRLTRPQLRSIQDGLQLSAPTAEQLRLATLRMRTPRWIQGCVREVCEFSSLTRPQEQPVQEPMRGAEFTLADVLPRPWVATGEGEKSLSFRWAPPPHWDILGTPKLELNLRLPQAFHEQKVEGSVHVFLNEQPLDSWLLRDTADSHSDQRRLVVAIPERFHSKSDWGFRVVVRLRIPRDEPCAWVEPLSSWLMIENTSGLFVSRRESVRSGISGFFHQLKERPVLSLQHEDWAAVLKLAQLLVPIAQEFPAGAWSAESSCKQCLRLLPIASTPAPLEVERAPEGEFWVDHTGAAGIPRIATPGTVLVHVDEDSLNVRFGQDLGALEELAVDWRRLRSTRALLVEGEWIEWGVSEVTNEKDVWTQGAEATTTAEPSQKEHSYWLANLLWILTLAGIGAFSVVWVRRSRGVAS